MSLSDLKTLPIKQCLVCIRLLIICNEKKNFKLYKTYVQGENVINLHVVAHADELAHGLRRGFRQQHMVDVLLQLRGVVLADAGDGGVVDVLAF